MDILFIIVAHAILLVATVALLMVLLLPTVLFVGMVVSFCRALTGNGVNWSPRRVALGEGFSSSNVAASIVNNAAGTGEDVAAGASAT